MLDKGNNTVVGRLVNKLMIPNYASHDLLILRHILANMAFKGL